MRLIFIMVAGLGLAACGGGGSSLTSPSPPDRVTRADLNLGDLRSGSGAQSYAMPNDGSGYPYVLIW